MKRNTLILILSTIFSSVALQAGQPEYTPAAGYKVINTDAQLAFHKAGLAACRSVQAQELADKLADVAAAVLVNALKSASITREQAKLGKEFIGIGKSGVVIARQGISGVNQKLKVAGLNIKAYVIYQKFLGMMPLRAELTKALLNELQKPDVIENLVTQAHTLARFVLEGIGSKEDRIQALCDLLASDKVKSLCILVLSNAYERSVRPSSKRNQLIAPALGAKIQQLAEQVNLACMSCFFGRPRSRAKEAQETEQAILQALLELALRMEERIYNAVEQALNAKL